MTMTTTCAHVALAETAEGWGTCPDCGQMENADRVRRDIAERLGLLTLDEHESKMEAQWEAGRQDGKDYWWDEATDAYTTDLRDWMASRIAMLSDAIDTLNKRLDIGEQNDAQVDAAIAHLWEVHDALDRHEWEK